MDGARFLKAMLPASAQRLAKSAWAEVTSRLAYRIILRRPIQPAERASWKARLVEGRGNLVPLVNGLFTSEEYHELLKNNPGPLMLQTLHAERCRLVQSLPKASRILDLGGSAGQRPEGALIVMGYPHGFEELVIVDVPPNQSLEQRSATQMFDVVETPNGRVRYIYRHMKELGAAGLPDGSFDLVWMGQSVEHIEESEFDQLLPTVYKLLRPGGQFCLDTPNRRLTRLQAPYGFIHPDHKIEYEAEALRTKLTKSGFEIMAAQGIGLMEQSLREGRFIPREMIDKIAVNSRPEESYVLYFAARRPAGC
jgi:SAM-dependent methyltransferase